MRRQSAAIWRGGRVIKKLIQANSRVSALSSIEQHRIVEQSEKFAIFNYIPYALQRVLATCCRNEIVKIIQEIIY
jgi:hypothetical protein